MWLSAFLACAPAWTVVTPANPNPLVGVDHLDLAPLRFGAIQVEDLDEARYLAPLTAEQQDNWAEAKRVLSDQFRGAAAMRAARCQVTLDPPGGPGDYTISAEVLSIQPGFYAAIVSGPSDVELSVQLTHRRTLVEKLRMRHSTSASSMSIGLIEIPSFPTIVDRLREDGRGLGVTVGDYVCARVAGK